jgi:hypothetical protein
MEIGGVRWRLAPGTDPERASALIERAMAALESGAANLKTGRRKRLYALNLTGGPEPDHLLKVNGYRPLAGVLHWARRSKASRELDVARALTDRGLPAIVPLAAGEKRAAGRLLACFLLVPIVKDVTDLRRIWFGPPLGVRERHTLVRAFGAFSRRTHDAGFFQDDFAPNNFLVRRGVSPEFLLVDFERTRIVRRVPRDGRVWMLAKFDRALCGASAADRLRFLEAYAESRAQARAWWEAVARFAPRLARRDFRRMRRNATTEGRRFRLVREGAFRGFARKDAMLEPAPAGADGNASVLPEVSRAVSARADFDARPSAQRSIVAGDGYWDLACGNRSERDARRIWAVANFLWDRGALCPRPRFLLRRRGETFLRLEREPRALLLAEAGGGDAARRAVCVLLERLTSMGEVAPALDPRDVAVLESRTGVLRAQLVDPSAFTPGSPSARPMERARIRSLAGKLAACAGTPAVSPPPGAGSPGHEAAGR